jgi:hypothetical protein
VNARRTSRSRSALCPDTVGMSRHCHAERSTSESKANRRAQSRNLAFRGLLAATRSGLSFSVVNVPVAGYPVRRRHVAVPGLWCRTIPWLLIFFLFLGVAAPQAQQSPDLPAPLAAVLPELKAKTKVPILLPTHLPPLAEDTIYAHVEADADGYTIRLESDPDCDGANACFLGMLRAKRGGRFSFPETVKLSETTTARYKPTTCGGSCSEQAIEWKYDGVLYTAQLNLKTESKKEALAEMLELARVSQRPR